MASKKHPCARKSPPAWCGKSKGGRKSPARKAGGHPCASSRPPSWCNKKKAKRSTRGLGRGVGCGCDR